MIDRRTLLTLPLGALALRGQTTVKEVRLLSLAPSPYTRRRDSFRAGAGILLNLRRLVEEHQLPATGTYIDAAAKIEKPAELPAMMRGADVLLLGSSVWAQGPSWVIRKFFEVVNGENLAGVAASTWVTSGGVHTGAEMAHDSTLTTLRGMGAATFTFGQKQMIFATDERVGVPEKAGDFTLLDCWFMEGLAKASLVHALAGGNPPAARALWTKLGSHPQYYHGPFPTELAPLEARFGKLRAQLNAAANPKSEARQQLDALLKA